MLAPTIVVLSLILSSSAATVDVLTQGQVMNSSQTIISNGSIFELGFFSFGLGNSRTQKRFYLGIWYKQASANSNRTIVWVANRDKPIISNYSSCFLTINNDGNLAIFDRAISIPITSLPSTTNVTATLLDSGNFVLRQNRGDGTNASSLLWQSFDYPTDTSLPGVRIEYNRKTGKTYKLTSWKSPDDPSPGHYSLLLDTERMAQFLILNGSQPLWTSGAWNGHNFRYSPEMAWTRRLYTFNYYSNGSESYFLVNNVLSNESVLLTRYVMDISGKIQQFTWVESSQSWVKYWEQPKQQCNVYSYCGSNSICDKGHYPYCKCLEGFRPQNLRDWNGGNWSSGCGRRSALQCGDQDGFLIMKNMSLPLDPKVLQLQSAADCKSSCFGTCACNAYAYSNNQCLVWHGSLFNVRQADYDGEDLLLKLPAFEIKNYEELINMNSRSSNHSRFIRLSVGLALPFIASILIFGSIFHYLSKRKSKQRGRADTDLDLMLFDFTTKTKPTKRELLKPRNSTVKDEIWDVELPFFSFSSICTATNNFSNANKIGQGGFGPVYKGTLQSGHVVAVKRLSARSCQGLEELKNETTLIAKLQHRNLVKLLGCCIEGEEKILIYEYMTNKSLDLTIFDPNSQVKLSWERRTTIIEGIAQGLLYLHQYSRLRIIHRDLKTSNILLDDQLNPKISDFGMARIFEDNRTQANTNRIVGTFGYMSPEYAMKGLFSIKSDVYSFGVLLLEIISGQKNSSFYPSNESSLNLIGHAWNLWQDERELELVDQYLIFSSSSFPTSPTKYIQLALLCVQEKPSDRPTMSEVNAMLSSDSVTLPLPKQPAFCFDRGMVLSSGEKPYSINDITVSLTAR